MELSNKGVNFIRDVEGCKLYSYLDTGGVWTIGVGHTGPEVCKGLTWTVEQVNAALSKDVREASDAVNKLVKVKLNQDQFDALVSFTFNVGVNAFKNSTLLRKLNAGDFMGVGAEFLRWNKDNGKEVLGLTNRRKAEVQLFNSKR